MQYLGGKTRIAKQLAAEIDKVRRPGQWVWDAFCGGLSMTKALSVNGPVYSTDACVPLIALYRAVQAGWDPPTEVSREQWQAAKALPDTDPMKAFCGFGCSMSGAWFKAYAKDDVPGSAGFKSRFYARACRTLLLKDTPGMTFDVANFLTVAPKPLDGVLYLDPPYAGTVGYDGAPPFDHAAFYSRVREWSTHCHVFVSEYQMPFGVEVWTRTQKAWIRNSRGPAQTERLYYIAKGSL
jgi:DNA adenine methylase